MKKTNHAWMLLWLLGPLSTLAVYGVYNMSSGAWPPVADEEPVLVSRQTLEMVALILLGTGWVIMALRLCASRDLLLWFLAAAMSLLLFRELHFESIPALKETSELGIYIGLPTLLILGFVLRNRVTASVVWGKVRPWLVAAFVTYVYSVLISRRVFRFLPYENEIHIPLEEAAETVAHSLTLCMCFFSCLALRRKDPSR